MWNVDLFAQDGWKIRSNLTSNTVSAWATGRTMRSERARQLVRPHALRSQQEHLHRSGAYTQLNGVRVRLQGQAPLGLFPNRAFALPRVNLAWDIRGTASSVLRGGYGMFANRPMGNVEYNPVLNNPPNAYNVTADAFYDTSLGGTGLTYDTVHLIPFTALLGLQMITTPTPQSFTSRGRTVTACRSPGESSGTR